MAKTISKSSFLKGLQCHKALHLKFYHPELADEISDMQQAIFQSGTDVGMLAQQLFPGGINPSPDLPKNYQKSIEDTRELIQKKQPVIYEAGFENDGLVCFMDILVFKNDKWHAFEVKSSTGIKEVNLWDTAFQYYVMTKCGLDIADISLVYINNQYVRQGEIDVQQLFVQESVLKNILPLQTSVIQQIATQQQMLINNNTPNIDIGEYCDKPYLCEFHGHCWQHIPDYSIFNIGNLRTTKKFELYHQGVVNITDIPANFPLNSNQWLQVNAEIHQKPLINKTAISDYLSKLEYPLYFLDFETFGTPVPLFDGARPYQQIPFQYSLHTQTTPDRTVEHKEFLADNKGDPRLPFIKQLISDLGEKGHIIVYNQGFESARLRELSVFLLNSHPGPATGGDPGSTPEAMINAINHILTRITDLMLPFQQKWVYTPEMKGSYSIKHVLPALVPELSYKTLGIQEGGSASRAFIELYGDVSDGERTETRKNLLEYCKMDTLAMVEILKKLKMLSR